MRLITTMFLRCCQMFAVIYLESVLQDFKSEKRVLSVLSVCLSVQILHCKRSEFFVYRENLFIPSLKNV